MPRTLPTGLTWLAADHLGSTSVMINAADGTSSEIRYAPWGETRHTSGTPTTDRKYTGQREDSYINLYWMGSRWYDPALGRFISPDSIIPGMYNPLAYDRYSYVYNNPVRYNDPTGHWACDAYDPSCAENQTETAQYQVMSAGYQPGSACAQDPLCHDSYTTLLAVVEQLGRVPSINEILIMTAGTEYFIYAGRSDVRAVGKEGLARNYYQACKTNGCYGNELYSFLAGFQPWWGSPYILGDGSASERANHLITNGLNNTFSGMSRDLITDVQQMLDLSYAQSQGWAFGKMTDRPWQWYGPFIVDTSVTPGPTFGYGTINTAILSVSYTDGSEFWMFTGYQDSVFNLEYWRR